MDWKEIHDRYLRGGGMTPEETKAFRANLRESRKVNKSRTGTEWTRYVWENCVTETQGYSASEFQMAVLEHGRLIRKLPCPA